MAVCLNTDSAYKIFEMLVHDRFFVDKTGIIETLNARINTMNRYICITKPRKSDILRNFLPLSSG